MGIFSRRKNREGSSSDEDQQAPQAQAEPDDGPAATDTAVTETDEQDAAGDGRQGSAEREVEPDAPPADAEAGPDGVEERLPRPHPADRSKGPFDRAEVDGLDSHLSFGALAISPIEGMELRLDVDESGQQITSLTAVRADSACQLQAFAAPKSRGIWDDIRDEIADGLVSGGGSAVERLGPLGIELHVRMPGRGADGRTIYSPARFIGVDGPRWFLRAVLSGTAAVDEDAAEPFLEYIRRTVVLRGKEARAPRELLPFEVPAELTEAAQDAVQVEQGARGADGLNPFERGPEITEVR